ncbi:MAG: hypothetical protein N2594_03195 [Clostridiales bacterium]|nr:hypothetical protein [Clostridiales bacterium]
MWTVIYLAHSVKDAQRIEEALTTEGFLVKVREVGKNKNGQGTFEIMVPNSEAEDANMLMPDIITR